MAARHPHSLILKPWPEVGREGRNDRQTHVYKTWGQVGFCWWSGTNCCKPSGIPACLLYVTQGALLGSLGRWSPIGQQSQTVSIPEEEDAVDSLWTHGSIIHKVLYLTQEKKTLLISSLCRLGKGFTNFHGSETLVLITVPMSMTHIHSGLPPLPSYGHSDVSRIVKQF